MTVVAPHDLTELLGVRAPVVSAPMGGVAGGRLAAAVSAAGGLGMVGSGSSGSAVQLQTQLALVPSGVRIGIGLVDWVARRDPALLDLAIGARPVLLSVCFGDDLSWVAAAQQVGILTAVQVAEREEAVVADRAGVDLIVARGLEGGGHGRPLRGRDELLPDVLEVTERPVLAAGAVATRDDVRRQLARGAAGVWVGTAFLTATEALTPPGSRRAALAATSDDTLVTTVFDQAAGHAWPPDLPERVLANAFTTRWHDTGLGRREDLETAAAELAQASAADDPVHGCVNAGMGVGHLTAERSAADILADLTP